jgi:hypothetical protein
MDRDLTAANHLSSDRPPPELQRLEGAAQLQWPQVLSRPICLRSDSSDRSLPPAGGLVQAAKDKQSDMWRPMILSYARS